MEILKETVSSDLNFMYPQFYTQWSDDSTTKRTGKIAALLLTAAVTHFAAMSFERKLTAHILILGIGTTIHKVLCKYFSSHNSPVKERSPSQSRDYTKFLECLQSLSDIRLQRTSIAHLLKRTDTAVNINTRGLAIEALDEELRRRIKTPLQQKALTYFNESHLLSLTVAEFEQALGFSKEQLEGWQLRPLELTFIRNQFEARKAYMKELKKE